MATSGTVGQTVFDTATVIETAFRRCRVHPSKQTPEKIQIAKNALYLILVSSGNLGLNLWAVESAYVGLRNGSAIYQTPVGTIDLLNLVFSTPFRVTGTDSSTGAGISTDLGSATNVVRFGVRCSFVSAGDTLTISSSPDGVTWTTIRSVQSDSWVAGTYYWFTADPSVTAQYFKAEFALSATVSDFYLANRIYDLPVVQWNRDTWSLINDKQKQGHPSTNYYYEKLLRPQVTLWPVPDVDTCHLTMFLHRQVQDVGTLIQELEIPNRWFNSITWQLAELLCFEIEDVDPAVIPTVVQMSAKNRLEAENEESDGAPLYIAPKISGYTR